MNLAGGVDGVSVGGVADGVHLVVIITNNDADDDGDDDGDVDGDDDAAHQRPRGLFPKSFIAPVEVFHL